MKVLFRQEGTTYLDTIFGRVYVVWFGSKKMVRVRKVK